MTEINSIKIEEQLFCKLHTVNLLIIINCSNIIKKSQLKVENYNKNQKSQYFGISFIFSMP